MEENKKHEIAEMMKQELGKKEQQPVPKNEPRDKSEAQEIVGEIHKAAIVETVKSSEQVQKKVVEQAQKTIDNELESLEYENKTRKQKVAYDANKEACRNYGIDDSVPTWQVQLMKVGSGFWFVIYFLFATITIAPVNIFFKGINAFIKNNYIVFVFAILAYLIIVVGIPVLITQLG
jgi:hypothetical protein